MSKKIDRDKTGRASHPLRDDILFALDMADGPMSPIQLSRLLGNGLSNLSYHIRVLREMDCIKLVKTAPVRGSVEHYYALQPGIVVARDADARALDEICNLLPTKQQRDQVLNEIASILQGTGRNTNQRQRSKAS